MQSGAGALLHQCAFKKGKEHRLPVLLLELVVLILLLLVVVVGGIVLQLAPESAVPGEVDRRLDPPFGRRRRSAAGRPLFRARMGKRKATAVSEHFVSSVDGNVKGGGGREGRTL